MVLKMALSVSGLKGLAAKVRTGDDLFKVAWAEQMAAFGVHAEEAARAAAPVASGRLAASITHKLQAKPMPMWVKVKTTARATGSAGARAASKRQRRTYRGYPYPARLEFSRSSKHKGWLRKSFLGLAADLATRLENVAHAMEGRWSS